MQRVIYSGTSAIKENAVADPKRGLHMEVKIRFPPASNTLMIPKTVRRLRAGDVINAHLRYCVPHISTNWQAIKAIGRQLRTIMSFSLMFSCLIYNAEQRPTRVISTHANWI